MDSGRTSKVDWSKAEPQTRKRDENTISLIESNTTAKILTTKTDSRNNLQGEMKPVVKLCLSPFNKFEQQEPVQRCHCQCC